MNIYSYTYRYYYTSMYLLGIYYFDSTQIVKQWWFAYKDCTYKTIAKLIIT